MLNIGWSETLIGLAYPCDHLTQQNKGGFDAYIGLTLTSIFHGGQFSFKTTYRSNGLRILLTTDAICRFRKRLSIANHYRANMSRPQYKFHSEPSANRNIQAMRVIGLSMYKTHALRRSLDSNRLT